MADAQTTLMPHTMANLDRSASDKSVKVDKPATPSRLLAGADLEAFKVEVGGSEHNKAVLVGLLKKKFPKVSKAILSDTLGAVATRVGRNESDKKWVLIM